MTGSVNAAHQWVNMTDVSIELDSTRTVSIRTKRNTNPEDQRDGELTTACVYVCVSTRAQVKTCKPALGHSFAAGTTDGGGDLNFTQGESAELICSFSNPPKF